MSSLMSSPSALASGARGVCPALAMFQTCHACPFVSACPYKAQLGDYGQEQNRSEEKLAGTIKTLIGQLRDETADGAARDDAADALLVHSEDQTLPAHVRGEIVVALGEHGDARIFEKLCGTLIDQRLAEGYSVLREEAALALGDLGDARAIPILTQMLEDWRPGVRFACAVALGRLGRPEGRSSLQLARTLRLGDDFGQLNDQIHEMCAFSLALLGDADMREPLETLLTSEDRLSLSRAEILFALGELGNPESLPLIHWLRSEEISEGLRRYTAITLGRLGCNEAREELIQCLSITDGDLDIHAARALAKLDDASGVEVLAMRGLASRIGYLRRISAESLLALDTLQTRRLVMAYLEHEPVAAIQDSLRARISSS